MSKGIDPSRVREAKRLITKHSLDWWWYQIPGWERSNKSRFLWFKAAAERSAFLYELSARMGSGYEFGKHWLALDGVTQASLANRWPPNNHWNICFAGPVVPDSFDLDMNPTGTHFALVSYNLAMSNDTLVKAFLEHINQERRRKNIFPKPNEGCNRRGYGWRVLELMDIRAKGIRPLTSSERSQISKFTPEHFAYLTRRV